MLWVERYRPDTFDEIAGNDEIVVEIESAVKSGNMNHMFFYGPPGVGKTTTASVIAKELYGSESNQHFKELNASDERGIDIIRDQVKTFAGKKTLTGDHKIVFLDEGDSLTPDAQQALRRIMENYQDKCRFIISGNDETGLIDAIRSRCLELEFEPVDDGAARDRLEHIIEQEDADVDPETLDKIVTVFSGDLRKQISKLQGAALGEVSLDSGEDYLKLLKMISNRNYIAATKMATEENTKQLYRYLMARDDVPGRVKADMSIAYAKYTWRMHRSPDKDIQMNALIAELTDELSQHIT